MTITSVGYAGTVNDAEWARLVPLAGQGPYTVESFAAFRVTASAGTRTIQVAASLTDGAAGRGIRDVNDAVITKSLASVPSGVRWDLIVLRRTWATKATTVEVVQGGSAKAIPPRTANPGVVDEQPLALVRVAAGSNAIQEIVDLRVFVQNGGACALDDLVRSYVSQPGTVIRIGDIVWTRVVNAAGSPVWLSDDMSDTGWVAVARGTKWLAVPGYALQVRRIGKMVEFRGAVKHQTGALIGNLAVLPAGFRPSSNVPVGFTHASRRDGMHGQLFVTTAGQVWVSTDYLSGSLGTGDILMLHGTFFLG